MAGSKRAFPYYSALEDFEVSKRPALQGFVNPSREAAQPRAFDGGIPLQVGHVYTGRHTCM